MLFQPDAQQVRAARLLHRVRWIRVRFDHPPTPLNHGPISPCITLAMVHGCSQCAFKASAMSWSAWDSNVHSDQIRACEKVCTPATIGGNYAARLGMPQSGADELQRSLARLPLRLE